MQSETPKPWAGLPATEPLLRPKEAAAFLGYSKPHYYRLAASGDVPPLTKLGRGQGGASVVPRAWLQATLDARFAASAVL